MNVGGFNFTQRTLLCIGRIGSDTYACVTNIFLKGAANIYQGDLVYVNV